MKKLNRLLLILLAVFMSVFCIIGCGDDEVEEKEPTEYELVADTYYLIEYGVCDQDNWITLSANQTWTTNYGWSGTYSLWKYEYDNSYGIDALFAERGFIKDGVLTKKENGEVVATYMTGEACQREGISGYYATEENKLYQIDGTKILFGRFPQTIKAENVEVTEEPDENGYYQDNQGNDYIKVQAKRTTAWDDYKLDFSNYQELVDGEYYYFKIEPLKWSLLQEEDGTALLWCQNIVWAMQFQSQFALDETVPQDATCKYFVTAENVPENTPANNYYYSDVRAWLNDEFYNMAFTDEEKEIIVVDTVNNGRGSVEPFYDSKMDEFLCENTTDSVFLLSEGEIRNKNYGFSTQAIPMNGYASDARKRIRNATDYAKATGINFTPRDVANNSAVLTYASATHITRTPNSGSVGNEVVSVEDTCYISASRLDRINGVVPAIRLDLKTTTSGLKMGETEDKSGYVIFGIKDKTLKDIVIPKEIDGKPVKEIADNAFADCSNLQTLVIPDSIMKVGEKAFINCDNIIEARIPAHAISAIPKEKLQKVVITSGTEIPNGAFSGCETLTNVHIGDTVKKIGKSAFEGCSGLTSVVIPDSVTSIGDYAFSGCSGLTSITIPFVGATKDGTGNAKHFGWIFGASDYSSNSNYVPSSLKEVIITGGNSIGNSAFYGCGELTSIEIPDSVTSIDNSAFYACVNLSYTIEGGLKYLGNDNNPYLYLANTENKDITSAKINEKCKVIGDYAFSSCSGLTSISVAENNTAYASQDGILYNKAKTEFIHIPDNLTGDVIIPNGITSIGDDAFRGCSGLTSVVIGDGVTSIGSYAFEGCSGLTNIEIPDSVTSIGYEAFAYCSGLTSVVIPDSVTSIGYEAFAYCSGLTSVVIPDSVTSIGYFAFYACVNLSYTIENGIKYFGNDNNPYLYLADTENEDIASATINEKCRFIGEEAFYSCDSLTSVVIGDNVISIGYNAFAYCSELTSIEIPDSVTFIGGGAFSGCSGLTSVEIGDGVTSIGNYAFSGCSELTSIEIPDSVTFIGEEAFYECSGLTSVVIGDGVTSIGSYAFEGCSGLTSVVIGDSVTSIGDSAFSGCSGLTSVVIGDSVTSIDSYAFFDCDGLTSIEIPDSVTFIDVYAFAYCSGLTSVVIPDSVTYINLYAFAGCGLTSVYYNGTASDWANIKIIDSYNRNLINATRYYYIENEADVPTDGGNYWHYVDGVPTIWN